MAHSSRARQLCFQWHPRCAARRGAGVQCQRDRYERVRNAAATPNFNGTVTLSSSNPLPALGNAAAINQPAAAFTNGVSNNSLTWNEVGTIDLTASLSAYLGWDMSTAPVTGIQTNVGRFHPAYFDTTVTPGCATFTYAAQLPRLKRGNRLR